MKRAEISVTLPTTRTRTVNNIVPKVPVIGNQQNNQSNIWGRKHHLYDSVERVFNFFRKNSSLEVQTSTENQVTWPCSPAEQREPRKASQTNPKKSCTFKSLPCLNGAQLIKWKDINISWCSWFLRKIHIEANCRFLFHIKTRGTVKVH